MNIASRKFQPPQSLIRSRNQRVQSAPDIRSAATKKLEDVVLKSIQIVQSQSYRQVTSGGEAIAFPSPTYDAMYASILANDTARPMVLKKRDIAFREGIKTEPNFIVKCMMCDSEYDHKMERCEKCNGLVREPDPDEEKVCKALLKIKNANRQTLQDGLEEISVDHDVVDDGWLVSRNIYQELNGQIVDFETTEFWRVHPGNMAYSISEAGRIGEWEYTCIYHREYYVYNEFGKCGVCNRILHKVIAVRYKDQSIAMRYIAPEIFHGSEYNPSALYGFPPALTMWYNLVLTAAQTKYMADYYVEKKWPTAALFVPAKKRKTAELFKDQLDEEVNKDAQGRPVFRFDPDSKHKPEVIRMTDTPEEMNFIPVREESRMRMAAFWGISPIFNADVQASGGMNNESRQITVMGWATEIKQKSIRKHYLDAIIESHGIQDWHYELGQIEEEDEAAEVQLDLLKAQYATQMVSMGFSVELDDDGKPTKFEKLEQSQDPFLQGFPSPPTETPQMGDAEPPMAESTTADLPGKQSVMIQGTKSLKSGDLLEFLSKLPKKLINAYNNSKDMDKRKQFINLVTSEEYHKLTPDEVLDYVGLKCDKSIDDYNSEPIGIPIIDELSPLDSVPDHYTFTYEYDNDWEWAKDYDFIKFDDINVYSLNVHPDFALHPEDVKKGSPRVRKETLYYYAVETTEMRPLIVDQNYNLIDGHHRLYALMDKNQNDIRVAIVKPKDNGASTKAQQKAPRGGVTINGKFYRGGQFIPIQAFLNANKENAEIIEQKEENQELINKFKGKINPQFDVNDVKGETSGKWYLVKADVEDDPETRDLNQYKQIRELEQYIKQEMKELPYTFSNIRNGVLTMGIMNKNDNAPLDQFHDLVSDIVSRFDDEDIEKEDVFDWNEIKSNYQEGMFQSLADNTLRPILRNKHKISSVEEHDVAIEKVNNLIKMYNDSLQELSKIIKKQRLEKTETNPSAYQIKQYQRILNERVHYESENIKLRIGLSVLKESKLKTIENDLTKKESPTIDENLLDDKYEGYKFNSRIKPPKSFEFEKTADISKSLISKIIDSEIDYVKERFPHLAHWFDEITHKFTKAKTKGGHFGASYNKKENKYKFEMAIHERLDGRFARETIQHEIGHAISHFNVYENKNYYQYYTKANNKIFAHLIGTLPREKNKGHGQSWKDAVKSAGYGDTISWSIYDMKNEPNHPFSEDYKNRIATRPVGYVSKVKQSDAVYLHSLFGSRKDFENISVEQFKNMKFEVHDKKKKRGRQSYEYEIIVKNPENNRPMMRVVLSGHDTDFNYEKRKVRSK